MTNAILMHFICQSGLWSAPEEQQTIGRVWRQGQQEKVIVYRIFALDTADELLSGYANGKALMLEQFLGQQGSLVGLEGFESSDDETGSTGKASRQKKSKVAVRKRKKEPSKDCDEPTEGAEGREVDSGNKTVVSVETRKKRAKRYKPVETSQPESLSMMRAKLLETQASSSKGSTESRLPEIPPQAPRTQISQTTHTSAHTGGESITL
jgi:hypothetical protein